MEHARGRSRPGARVQNLTLRTGLGQEESWSKSVDESSNRRFSDSEERSQKSVGKTGNSAKCLSLFFIFGKVG